MAPFGVGITPALIAVVPVISLLNKQDLSAIPRPQHIYPWAQHAMHMEAFDSKLLWLFDCFDLLCVVGLMPMGAFVQPFGLQIAPYLYNNGPIGVNIAGVGMSLPLHK